MATSMVSGIATKAALRASHVKSYGVQPHFSGLRALPMARPANRIYVPRSRERVVMMTGQWVVGGTPSSQPGIDSETLEKLKRAVAKKAAEYVKSGMIVGLGTGSTSALAIEEIGKLVAKGKLRDVSAVPSSFPARVLARQCGIKIVDLNDVNRIDLAIDGADEVDPNRTLIKGGGAVHTLEKVVDTMAKRTIALVDQSKVVAKLGTSFPVPVEVLQPAVSPVLRSLIALGGAPEIRSALRKDGNVITDLGNLVVDVSFANGIADAAKLERDLNLIPGVVENGIFYKVADEVLVGIQDGNEVKVVELAEALTILGIDAAAPAAAVTEAPKEEATA